MKNRMWKATLIGLVLLLAGCGTLNPEPEVEAAAATRDVSSADEVLRIGVTEARLLVDAGQAVLYDTRSERSFRSSHAAGAVSFPEADAAARAGELPADQDIIFY
ncbi:MAG: rhodanese-like domain-containing protein [Anaerolineae bacterium]|jgi:hypothetical protein